MSDRAFTAAIKKWWEREAQRLRRDRPLPRTDGCLSWQQAYRLAGGGSEDALPEATRRHVGQCQHCRRLVRAFEAALGDVPVAKQRGDSAMSEPGIWESVREGVHRLKGALEISLTGAAGAGTRPTLAYAWRGAEDEEGQEPPLADVEQSSPSSLKTGLEFPELGVGLELEVERTEPSMQVSVQARPYFPDTEVRCEDIRVVFRRSSGEEMMACWLGEGDEMTIPRVDGGQFVFVITSPDVPSIYEIPLAVLA